MDEDGRSKGAPLICVIDDDDEVRSSLDSLLRSAGLHAQTFASPDEYLARTAVDGPACLILDIRLRAADGLEFQQSLLESEIKTPVILITGHGDIPMTVRGMKAGAIDFLCKPFSDQELLAAVEEAVKRDWRRRAQDLGEKSIRLRYDALTPREREVMALVTAGLMNKQVAGRLGISEITVKIHRGNLMRKMQAQSLADLVRMAEDVGAREVTMARYRVSY